MSASVIQTFLSSYSSNTFPSMAEFGCEESDSDGLKTLIETSITNGFVQILRIAETSLSEEIAFYKDLFDRVYQWKSYINDLIGIFKKNEVEQMMSILDGIETGRSYIHIYIYYLYFL